MYTKNDRAQRGNASTQYTVGVQGWAIARETRVYSEERLTRANLGGVGEGIAWRGTGARRWGRRRSGGSEEVVGDVAEHADVEAGGTSAVVVGDVDLRDRVDGVGVGRGSGESPEEGTIKGRWDGGAGVAGAWFGASGLWGGKRKRGGGLLQAGRQATVWRDVNGVADVGEET